MAYALQRWWKRFRERREAYRRVSRHLRRPVDAPFYYQTEFGRARSGRFEARRRWRQYVGRVLAAACALAVAWILWQSWIGLRIFAN